MSQPSSNGGVFRHCVRCRQSRHVYSVEGDRKRSVKSATEMRLQHKEEYRGQNKGRIKNQKYLEVSFFVQVRLVFTRRELGHGGGVKEKKKSGLEMRQECISTSLSFACKTRERLSSVPASNPTWTGAGAWEQFLGHALLSPCPLLPCCQEGETVRRKRGRKIKSWSHKLCVHTPTKDTKSTSNMYKSKPMFFVCVCGKSTLWLWTVNYMSSNRRLTWL